MGVALMGSLIVVVTLTLQSLSVVYRTRLSQVDQESFRLTDHFRDKLRYANDQMRQYASTEDQAAWQQFLAACQDLKSWQQKEEAQLTSESERKILHQMADSLVIYEKKATDLSEKMLADRSHVGASVAEYNAFLDQARHLMDLGQELGRTHYESRNMLAGNATRILTRLRLSVLGMVALMFLFGAGLAHGVYKELIAPLRTRLVESQALAERQEKLASLGLLAAGVAHELRTPLTAIKTALFIQQKKFEPGTSAYSDGRLIEREILRLERIVNQFLQFARPAPPELAAVPCDIVLHEVQALLSPELARSNIKISCDTESPLRMKVDAGQLKQVLINLVQNAADSIGHGGAITLRARPDKRHISDGETDVVVVEVTDTGKGIPPEVEKRLFDPFFTTKDSGTGLGLSIAARMVEMNGGSLQYQTQVNRGSTFAVVLPRIS